MVMISGVSVTGCGDAHGKLGIRQVAKKVGTEHAVDSIGLSLGSRNLMKKKLGARGRCLSLGHWCAPSELRDCGPREHLRRL